MKFKKASNPFKLVLVTESRDDLCALARILFEGMNPDLFTDKNNPVIVTVRGAWGSGKTIFPDIIRESCIPDAVCTAKGFHENERLDETYTGTHLGKPFDFTFINSDYPNYFTYSHDCIRNHEGDGRGIVFIGLRKNGGMTFIHNDDDAVMESSIDIWMEDGINPVEGTQEQSRLDKSSLKSLFGHHAHHPWRRYLEITVYDHRLFGEAHFMAKLEQCKGIFSIERAWYTYPKHTAERKKKNDVPPVSRRCKPKKEALTV